MSILKKVEDKPDLRVSDDDHPNRRDITQADFIKGANEIYEKNKDKPAVNKKSNRFAKATIAALNSLKMLFY